MIKFISRCARQDASRQIPRYDFPGRLADRLDFAHDPSAGKNATDQRECNGGAQAPHEGTGDHLLHLVQLVRAPADKEIIALHRNALATQGAAEDSGHHTG